MKRFSTPQTRLQVWDAICDQKSQALFNAIAKDGSEENLCACLKLTRKRYYTRISKLVNADLVKRVNGKYGLTAFGKVVYGAKLELSEALNDQSRLKSLEGLSSHHEIPRTKRTKMVDSLIVDDKIKPILLPEISRVTPN